MRLLRHPSGIPLTAMAYNTFGSPPATRYPSAYEKVTASHETRLLKAEAKEAKGGSFVTKNGEIFEYCLLENHNMGHRSF
jgi:hypothetical protein